MGVLRPGQKNQILELIKAEGFDPTRSGQLEVSGEAREGLGQVPGDDEEGHSVQSERPVRAKLLLSALETCWRRRQRVEGSGGAV